MLPVCSVACDAVSHPGALEAATPPSSASLGKAAEATPRGARPVVSKQEGRAGKKAGISRGNWHGPRADGAGSRAEPGGRSWETIDALNSRAPRRPLPAPRRYRAPLRSPRSYGPRRLRLHPVLWFSPQNWKLETEPRQAPHAPHRDPPARGAPTRGCCHHGVRPPRPGFPPDPRSRGEAAAAQGADPSAAAEAQERREEAAPGGPGGTGTTFGKLRRWAAAGRESGRGGCFLPLARPSSPLFPFLCLPSPLPPLPAVILDQAVAAEGA